MWNKIIFFHDFKTQVSTQQNTKSHTSISPLLFLYFFFDRATYCWRMPNVNFNYQLEKFQKFNYNLHFLKSTKTPKIDTPVGLQTNQTSKTYRILLKTDRSTIKTRRFGLLGTAKTKNKETTNTNNEIKIFCKQKYNC